MANELPDPLVPADADCRQFDCFMLNVERLLASELWAISTGDEFKAALGLWCRAWKQVPAGSLPDNDRTLAGFSGAGSKWRKVRDMALHGFIKCSDGRLYHPVLCLDVMRALGSQAKFRDRREKDAERLRKWREQRARNDGETRFETPDETRIDKDKDRDSEGVLNRIPSESEREESVAARDDVEGEEFNNPVVRLTPPPQAPKANRLRENIKTQLRQKLMRYCNATMSEGDKAEAIAGLMGADTNRDAQWWLDEIDRKRKREGWDDTREWKRQHLGAAQ